MKSMMRAVLGSGAMTLMLASVVHAGTGDPGIRQRERNQQRRIEQGVRSGELTANEARRLEKEQAAIRKHEKIMKSDGELTGQERRRLTREQNRAGKDIYRMKHNKRSR